MRFYVSHDRAEETPEAKARWFQSLTMDERMEMPCYFTEMVLSVNPNIADLKDAEQSRKGIQIVKLP